MEDGERQRQIDREVSEFVEGLRTRFWTTGPRSVQLSEQTSVIGAALRRHVDRLARECDEHHQKIRDATAG